MVAAAAAYLSVDEAAALHERLANVVPSGIDVTTYAWSLPGSLLAVAGVDSKLYTVGTLVEESVEMGACVYAVTVIIDNLHVRRTRAGVMIVESAAPPPAPPRGACGGTSCDRRRGSSRPGAPCGCTSPCWR